MPSPRHTDPGPAARPCPRCRTTHRTHTATGARILCPEVGRWLITNLPQQTTREDRP